MDSSSSSSSPLFPITTTKPSWDPSTSMENTRVFTLNSQEISSYNYTNFNYASAAAEPPPPAEREHMFDKVVTPSDVGKLNRLVIPKQHAEKYFPMGSSGNDKGLVLDFVDRNGKPWRFRYSYWNSSQSYVMTKGWSRFVKEKKLDAGDVVSFHRGVGEIARDVFYIDWRRRPTAPPPEFLQIQHGFTLPFLRARPPPPPFFRHQLAVPDHRQLVSVIEGYSFRAAAPHLQMQVQGGGPLNRIVETVGEPVVFESVPVVHGNATAKRLRLFGVNMDCGVSSGSRASAAAEDGRLELKLRSGVSTSSSSSSTSITTIDFLEKGKSLDFDI